MSLLLEAIGLALLALVLGLVPIVAFLVFAGWLQEHLHEPTPQQLERMERIRREWSPTSRDFEDLEALLVANGYREVEP